MSPIDTDWLVKAYEAIEPGLANKLIKDNVTIYRCGTIISIDIKP